MKIRFLVFAILVLIVAMLACDDKSSTEPETGSDPAELGKGIFVNDSDLKPAGISKLYINEGDTIELSISNILPEAPVYSYEPADNSVLKVVKHASVDSMAYAIAMSDSGAATTLKIKDSANKAEKTIDVQITAHWADPDYFTFIGSLDGHFYYLSNNARIWAEAARICRDAGGYMVAINSNAENELLDEGRGLEANVWVGLQFTKNAEGKWKIQNWDNGEPLTYENFTSKPGDPGIFAEYFFHMDESGRWENWHEIAYPYFLEME